MKILTQREAILTVMERFDRQYKSMAEGWCFGDGRPLSAVRAKLAELDLRTCSADDVAAILNDGWPSHGPCAECDENVRDGIAFGDCDGEPLGRLCVRCLQNAAAVAESIYPKRLCKATV